MVLVTSKRRTTFVLIFLLKFFSKPLMVKNVDFSQASSLKGSTYTMISSPLKHTYKYTPFPVEHTKSFGAFFERVAPRTLREINLRANISGYARKEAQVHADMRLVTYILRRRIKTTSLLQKTSDDVQET